MGRERMERIQKGEVGEKTRGGEVRKTRGQEESTEHTGFEAELVRDVSHVAGAPVDVAPPPADNAAGRNPGADELGFRSLDGPVGYSGISPAAQRSGGDGAAGPEVEAQALSACKRARARARAPLTEPPDRRRMDPSSPPADDRSGSRICRGSTLVRPRVNPGRFRIDLGSAADPGSAADRPSLFGSAPDRRWTRAAEPLSPTSDRLRCNPHLSGGSTLGNVWRSLGQVPRWGPTQGVGTSCCSTGVDRLCHPGWPSQLCRSAL